MAEVRRIVTHKSISSDNEELAVITIFEPSLSKQDIKKINSFSKRWGLIVNRKWVKAI